MAARKLSNGLLHKKGQKIIVKIIRKQKNKIILDMFFLNWFLFSKIIKKKKKIIIKGVIMPTILTSIANAQVRLDKNAYL